jgi:hypothetical protein
MNKGPLQFYYSRTLDEQTKQRARRKGAERDDYGCDYHPGFQQIAWVD